MWFLGLLISVGALNGAVLMVAAHGLDVPEPLAVTSLRINSASRAFQVKAVGGMQRNVLVVRCRSKSVEFEIASGVGRKWSVPMVTTFSEDPRTEPARARPLTELVAAELRKLQGDASVWFVYIVPYFLSDLGVPYVWTKEVAPTAEARDRGKTGLVTSSELLINGTETVLVRLEAPFATIAHLVRNQLDQDAIPVLVIPVFSEKMIQGSAVARKLEKKTRQFNGFSWAADLQTVTTETILSHGQGVARKAVVVEIQEPVVGKKKRTLRLEGKVGSTRLSVVRRLN